MRDDPEMKVVGARSKKKVPTVKRSNSNNCSESCWKTRLRKRKTSSASTNDDCDCTCTRSDSKTSPKVFRAPYDTLAVKKRNTSVESGNDSLSSTDYGTDVNSWVQTGSSPFTVPSSSTRVTRLNNGRSLGRQFSQISPPCRTCVKSPCLCMITSDYGTFTASATRLTSGVAKSTTSRTNAASDLGSNRCGSFCDLSSVSSDDDKNHLSSRAENTRLFEKRGITLIIPERNMDGYRPEEFDVKIVEDRYYAPCLGKLYVHASDVIAVEPHGATFSDSQPSMISLPLWHEVQDGDELICLCSNTSQGEIPVWERLDPSTYNYLTGRVLIKTRHFSLFTVVIKKPYPEHHKRIGRNGGTIIVTDLPGLSVHFPKGALSETLDAHVRVFYDDEHLLGNQDKRALASPIVMIGPHGSQFKSQPVSVRLPIPDYTAICAKFGRGAELSVWQSPTNETEVCRWEPVTQGISVDCDGSNNVTVSFTVYHFSFFKVLWDVLADSLYEAKLGMNYLHPFISFSMICQAWMEENKESSKFALEVICHRSDKKMSETTNYKHKVGRCLKPKLVRPGRISIKLKSELFEADIDAGEDKNMTKEETDFRGREFDKQFACRFKPNSAVDKGAFGKVTVERIQSSANELLFEFNLYKAGIESDSVVMSNELSERWSKELVEELAGSLGLKDDGNWKRFARSIGFTNKEIRSKLQYSSDPFLAMVNLYQNRGGTPEEFVQAMNSISREIRLESLAKAKTGSPPSTSGWSKSSGGSGSSGKRSSESRKRKWRKGESDADDDETDTESSGTGTASHTSRKRSKPSSKPGSNGSSSKRRRRYSDDMSEAVSSSEAESITSCDLRKDTRRLSETDLWNISLHMSSINWRALGRTLGLPESVILNVAKASEGSGIRECAYQILLEWMGVKPKMCTFGTLYASLARENMNEVAKKMEKMNVGLPPKLPVDDS